ncbi:MAG: DUF2252 domain-containing protein [Vulcanimicrobiaceae bacterium]
MAADPFAFFRGSAVIMAADLAATPVSGISVQLCGDAHCMNFGGYATPERHVVFDVNDFDETLPGPWEWDVKRLVTSVTLAARHNKYKGRAIAAVTLATVSAYRRRMAQLAEMSALDVWYTRIEAQRLLDAAATPNMRRLRTQIVEPLATASIRTLVEKLTHVADGAWRFRDDPPLLVHSDETTSAHFDIATILASYSNSLRDDVADLYGRYRLIDTAIKIVGVGSVGTHCGIALLAADDHDPLLLQIKEATASVLEAYCPRSAYAHHGERVVRGQHLMQTASDIFLGWGTSGERHYYIRQFKDMKASADIEGATPVELARYAEFCAYALAHAHSRSGAGAAIAGYLGKGNSFDRALLEFATTYADCVETDYRAFAATAPNLEEATADVSAALATDDLHDTDLAS